MLPFKRILWPTDFSELSQESLKVARELALKCEAELWMVHINDPLPIVHTEPVFSPTMTANIVQLEKDMMAYNIEKMQELTKQVRQDKLTVHPVVKAGLPSDEIVKLAEAEKIDLIVTATHGRSGISRFLFGSVAEKIIRTAPCPVVVVPAPSAAEHTRGEAQHV